MAGGNIHSYRAFLFQLSRNFNKENVEEMKFLLKDKLKATDLEGVDKAYQLFDLLEKRGELSENNINMLKALFNQLGREDQSKLVDKFISKYRPTHDATLKGHSPWVSPLTVITVRGLTRGRMLISEFCTP